VIYGKIGKQKQTLEVAAAAAAAATVRAGLKL